MPPKWTNALSLYTDRRAVAIFALGISAGLPLALVASTLSAWFEDLSLSLTTIGLFALVRTPYSFKFVWSPIIDRVRLPWLTQKLGRRRSWGLVMQAGLILSILGLSFSDPTEHLSAFAVFALVVGFFAASQDIVIDAFRIETFEEDEQGVSAASYVFGYRIGLLISTAGALALSTIMDWGTVYAYMSLFVLIGMATFLLSKEPDHHVVLRAASQEETRLEKILEKSYPRPVAVMLAWGKTAIYDPFAEFLRRRYAWVIILFIILYKLSDAYIGMMANPFYLQIGFSKLEIAGVTKGLGLLATLVGTFFGGLLVKRHGLYNSLMICGVLQILSNFVFALQAYVGDDIWMLSITIFAENIASGMGGIAFIAYLSSLTNVAYTATQYALLSSVMLLPRDWFTATSGYVADIMNWMEFFIFSGLLGLPALVLLVVLKRKGLFKI